MAEARGQLRPGEGRPLRCESCGEQIGEVITEEAGRPEDIPNVVLRCYACLTSEWAESVTAEQEAGE